MLFRSRQFYSLVFLPCYFDYVIHKPPLSFLWLSVLPEYFHPYPGKADIQYFLINILHIISIHDFNLFFHTLSFVSSFCRKGSRMDFLHAGAFPPFLPQHSDICFRSLFSSLFSHSMLHIGSSFLLLPYQALPPPAFL